MNDEEAFQAALDANPEDHTTRLVFADWLQERGEERAEGYRALGVLRLHPEAVVMAIGEHQGAMVHVYGSTANDATNQEECPDSNLPADWFKRTVKGPAGDTRWRRFLSRSDAEDAAAMAFAKLPAKLRTELLTKKGAKRKVTTPKRKPKPKKKSKGKK